MSTTSHGLRQSFLHKCIVPGSTGRRQVLQTGRWAGSGLSDIYPPIVLKDESRQYSVVLLHIVWQIVVAISVAHVALPFGLDLVDVVKATGQSFDLFAKQRTHAALRFRIRARLRSHFQSCSQRSRLRSGFFHRLPPVQGRASSHDHR